MKKQPDRYGTPDQENPEWTEQDFKQAKPFAEMFPHLTKKPPQKGKPTPSNRKAA